MLTAMERIKDDAFISKVRALFTGIYGRDLEFALTDEGSRICNDAFFIRAVNYHTCMLPWIESVFSLHGKSVLEIGCGSGAATLALSHRCARVDAFDIDPVSIDLASERAGFVGATNVSFHLLDADWALPDRISDFRNRMLKDYDVVLLPAVLEHLRMDERLAVLKTTWDLLRSRGIMVIYDTPNRLYAYDVHSFRLPFFNWLPDDLALLYAFRSPRREFPQILNRAVSPMDTLYRLGRGVSYHEFDLAIGLSEFAVINDGYSRLLSHREINSVFEGVLMHIIEQFSPHVPPGFSKQYLEMVLQKKWQRIALVQRHLVSDEMFEAKQPALVVEGDDAYLEYDVVERGYRKVIIEVLNHPWSSVLLLCDKSDRPFYRKELYRDYAVTEVLEVPIPENLRELRVRVAKHSQSQGNQAWILGVGADR
jgi:2-polyprenyl-3-methyl-5-hydroxy-6-metoxy-1,4-benzoquinol methylase